MKEINLNLPADESTVRALRVGDIVKLSGIIATGRDRIHKYLFDEKPSPDSLPVRLQGSAIYHCGPIVKKTDIGWQIVSAGPTTSGRLDIYEPWVIEHYGLRAIIGKGGMGAKTHSAMMKFGCVYLHAMSGAAAYLADRVLAVNDVFKLDEFGMAEAMWLLEVENFPVVVTMDTHGKSIHNTIEDSSKARLQELIKTP